MKNVEILTKLRRLVKSLAVIGISIVLGLGSSAFKSASINDNDGTDKKLKKDTTDKYGFKSLFSNGPFDASKPYITQINPQAVSYVQNYIKVYGKHLERIKLWGKPYLDMYDGILSEHGLPKELKYLSVIESDLKAGAVSVAGAVGPWQIMDFEARRMGLKVNGKTDERSSYYKSTHAAARILKELYTQFDDWLLVLAAYNAGQGRVRQAIKKSGSKDFWVLQKYLPLETRNHVKKFIGTHYVFEGNGGLTTMTAAETDLLEYNLRNKQLPSNAQLNYPDTKMANITGRYNAAVLAKNIGMDIKVFQKLNPNFDQGIRTGEYALRLPAEKMKVFVEKKDLILNESLMGLLNGA